MFKMACKRNYIISIFLLLGLLIIFFHERDFAECEPSSRKYVNNSDVIFCILVHFR